LENNYDNNCFLQFYSQVRSDQIKVERTHDSDTLLSFVSFMRYAKLIVVGVMLLRAAAAQQNDFNFINFSSKNGLSSNTINDILKDSHGYMWFATDDGLNKFDGVNFTVYRHNPGDSTSIGAGPTMTFREDRFGHIWAEPVLPISALQMPEVIVWKECMCH
jgi:sugar lactone lactonase YvrE